MSVACTVLPSIVARYKRQHPGVNIHVYEGVHGNVIESVRSGVADIGLTYLDDIASIFTQTPLSTQYFHVVLPKGHALEKRRQISWSAVQNEQMVRSEEHTSELQSLMRISYAVFCLKKKKNKHNINNKP